MEEIQLTNKQIVRFKKELSWWDVQELEAALSNRAVYRGGDEGNKGEVVFDGEATLNAKIKLLEKTIHSIVEKDGENEKEVPFSDEWVKALSVTDGQKLYAKADAFQSQIKKE